MIERMEKEDFDLFFSALESSFPPEEYRTYDGQRELLENEKYKIYVLRDGEGPKAFITMWDLDGFQFLEHFVVDPAYRNQGLGAKVLGEIKSMLSGPICFEVEPPETEYARRRIAFYQRNGFHVNDYPYIQPPYSRDKKGLPLLIMTSGGKMSPEQLEKMKQAIYKNVYRV